MDYTYVPPPTPTWARWRALYRQNPRHSVLRALQYEAVSNLTLTGDILDFGGGQKAKYLHLLADAASVSSVNIEEKIAPTHLIEPGEPVPFEDDRFDCVVCFNTLEHIYDAQATLAELYRVLRPGGRLVITVPFIFRIHGHPDDYFRATPSWWRQTCAGLGFSTMRLHPLIWGCYTSAGLIFGSRGLFPRLRSRFDHFMDWLYACLAFPGGIYDGRRGERVCSVASGWMMEVTK
ncbi:MAG: methyltransferase domain-containing protein [Pseudomonadota bacterium]